MRTDETGRKNAHTAAIGLVCVAAVVAILGAVMPVASQSVPLSPLGIELVGQRELLTGGPAALRVVVTDHQCAAPVAEALVTIGIRERGGARERRLMDGYTDARGTLNARFNIPDLDPGSYELLVAARKGADRDTATQEITLKRGSQVLLTTDKPIYKPGQLIHIRALALRKPTMRAVVDREMTLEVADAKGNKVFKSVKKTNAYGIASADFQLADEVNQGRYRVRAILDGEPTEKTVTVEPYVLPKFRIKLDTDRPYYLPGQRAELTVQADYFFGQPVAHGAVEVSVKTFDVQLTEVARLTGKTDAKGHATFSITLPTSFVGQPLEQGNAYLQFDVKVTDGADHSEQVTTTSTVAAADLMVNAVPEAGRIIPNVPNTVLFLLSDPTGRPVQGRLKVTKIEALMGGEAKLAGAETATDETGVGELSLSYAPGEQEPELGGRGRRMRPALAPDVMMGGFGGGGFPGIGEAAGVRLTVRAWAQDGRTVEKEIELTTDLTSPNDAILLRTDKALYAVGDTVRATALTPASRGTIYFDLIKDRQTMLTYAAEIEGSRAQVLVPLTADLSGGLYLSAYRIMPSGNIVRDTRPLYVQPASELQIGIRPDKDTYEPGTEANVHFTVTGSDGQPVQAALGINIVDEAVFALQDLQPGMERVYFYLEQELMKPRYEIHGLEMPVIIGREPGDPRPIPLAEDPRKQQAARVIFASAEVPDLPTFQLNSYSERLAKAREEWTKLLAPIVAHIQEAINQYMNTHDGNPPPAEGGIDLLIRQRTLKERDLYDPWGRRMVVKAGPGLDRLYWVIVGSLGPDGKKETEDDLWMMSIQTEWAGRDENEALMGDGGWGFGGMGGGVFADGMVRRGAAMGPGGPVLAMPVPMMAEAATADLKAMGDAGEFADKSAVRVRTEFPETLVFEPSLITDEQGKATLPIASVKDSITTFRIGAMANSAAGALGSTTGSLRVYLDFHIDLDLPIALTQNDQISIPVSVRNFMDQPQRVRVEMEQADWFIAKSALTQEFEIGAGEVKGAYFTIVATKIGDQKLKVYGLGTKMSDAVENVIRVEPDGQKVETTINDRLSETVEHTVTIPEGAVADASTILVKIYPGIFSQAVEGLDKILQMPFGCFEQTASVTYPNVLVLDYMKSTGQINPEIRMKAEGFNNLGYQRLVSYEVKGGGFSWFGDEPANKILTAYGLMLFHDMDAVHEVDRSVIGRTQDWLISQQNADGSWDPDKAYLHEESWGRIQNNKLLPSAYITWALAWSKAGGEALDKAVSYLRSHAKQGDDPYTLAILANGLVAADNLLASGKLDDVTIETLDRLIAKAKRDKDKMWWESEITGFTHSSGKTADLEATGLGALALINSGRYPQQASEVLNYIIANKDPNGTWHSTQATVLALRSLLLAQKGATVRVNAEVTVDVNGERVWAQAIDETNSDLMFQVDCKGKVKPGKNTVRIGFSGEGSSLYQIVGRYYTPWPKRPPLEREPLSITVEYDKTQLAVNDTVKATATVVNNTPATTSMVVVDLGVPPGFTVDPTDWNDMVDRKIISKYTLTGRQIIVYLEKLEPRQKVTLTYSLIARFPIKAKTPKSTVSEYYNPDNRADAAPVEMEVVEE